MTTSHLPRRAIVGAVLAASVVGSGLVAAFAAGEGGGLGLPAAGCNTVSDPKGDGKVGSQEGLPGSLPNDPDLDITGIAFGSNASALTAYLRLDKLDVRAAYGDGHAFSVTFTANAKVVDFTTFRFAAGQVNDGIAALPAPATLRSSYVKVGGKSTPIPFTATYDTANSMVIMSADRPALEKVLGGPVTTLGKIKAESATDIADLSETADLVDGGEATWEADSNACFGTAQAAASPAGSPTASPSPAPAPGPAGGAPAAGGGDPLTDYPAADCATYKDPKGDAIYNNTPNDPDLDITAYTLRTTPDALVAYIKVDKLGAKPTVTPLDGHRFYSDFTFNKHVFTVAASSFSSFGSTVRENAAKSGQVGPMAAMTVDSAGTGGDPGFTDAKVTAKFDTKASIVVLSVPLASIEKYGKAPLADATLTAVAGRSGADTGVLILPTDGTKSAKPAEDVYAVGDNHCFVAPTPPLSSVGATKAQYGDSAAVAAKLVDAAGAPVAGKTITFTLGASKATGTTGADGIAKAALPVKEKAGQRTLAIDAEGATASVPFTVLVEKTVLKATASKGNVTATLTDDDKKPVAGQSITFTSGAKKIVAKTNSQGVAKAGFAPGSAVKVSYAGAAGMYTAAATSAKA